MSTHQLCGTLCAGILLAAALPASAHRLQRSYADVKPQVDGVSAFLDFDPDDFEDPLQRRFDSDGSGDISADEMQAALEPLTKLGMAGFQIYQNGRPCPPTLRRSNVSPEAQMIRLGIWYECPEEGPLEVRMPLLDRFSRGHVHMLSVRLPDGIKGGPLTRNNPIWQESPGGSTWDTAGRYLVLGVQHILEGIDHVLFLLAILIGVARLRTLIGVVTLFTVAHSITLSAAALGSLQVPASIVEPAIALSIALVAAENIFWRTHRLRYVLIGAFGLIHGVGFADILIETGLPPAARIGALLAFNLGVELGQLAVVVPLFFAFRFLRQDAIVPRQAMLFLAAAGIYGTALAMAEPLVGVAATALGAALLAGVKRFGFQKTIVHGLGAALLAAGLVWFAWRVVDELQSPAQPENSPAMVQLQTTVA